MSRTWLIVMLLLLAACARPLAVPVRSTSYMAAPPPAPVEVAIEPPPMPPPPPPPPEPIRDADLDLVGAGGGSNHRAVATSHHEERTAAVAAAHSITAAPDAEADGLRPVTAEAAAQGVEQGVGSFAKPEPMNVGKWTTIKFFVGQAEQDVRSQSAGAALSGATAVYVAKAMRVRLSPNPSFEIKPTSDEDQLTGTMNKTATWSWQVKPINDGSKVIEAEIKVFALTPDGKFGQFIVGYSKSVPVEVHVSGVDRTIGAIDTASMVGNKLTGLFGTWQKTIGALVALLGAIGLLAWKLGLRKSKPE